LYDTFIIIQAEDIQVDIHLGHPEDILEDILEDIQLGHPDGVRAGHPSVSRLDIQLSVVSVY
tara:strand:- start:54 stop:239 length:186 start_codon:yes stop_codon:yes gene_type:complete